ncbi:MAG: hypothetical protein ACQERD_00795 [Campylobacterota bacterium]
MQIIIFSLIIIAIIVYITYRVKKSFTKKEIGTFVSIIVVIIAGLLYYNNFQKEKLPKAFKVYYKEQKGYEIEKLSIKQTNVQVLSSSDEIYDFIYIIKKDGKEYFCEAKNVESVLIEDEYYFKNFNEECKVK